MDEKIIELVMNLRPLDDDFMRIIFKDNMPLIEYFLRIILNKADLVVESGDSQFELGFFGSHKLFLDVFAKDSQGKSYNIEIQRSDSGAIPKRARFHASAVDVSALPKGDKFCDLPDTYVIFITENDVLERGRAAYNIERTIMETGELFKDGTHIIYVNGAYKNTDTALGRLIHDLSCKNAENMLCEPIAEVTRKYKTTYEGVEFMCKAVEEYANKVRQEGRDEGRVEGRIEGIAETVKKLINSGCLSKEKIASTLDLSLEEVEKIAAAC